jgi:hypothetical protein
MKRKKRKQKKHTPYFVFTLETITTAQKAMRLFEQPLGRVEGQPAKVEFAAETMQQVNGKLERMRTLVGLMCLTPFDYNEKIVLAAAIQLYILNLLAAPFDMRSQKELRQCRQIERFALDNLNFEQCRAMRD